MVTLIGIILVVVGVSDFGAAALIQAQQRQTNAGGLGEEPATPVVRVLKLVGLGTVVIGTVLIVVGLLA